MVVNTFFHGCIGIIGAKCIKKKGKIVNDILPPYTGIFILSEEVQGRGDITEICAVGSINNTTATSNSADKIMGTIDILIIEHIKDNLWKVRTIHKFYQDSKAKNKKHCKNDDRNFIGKKVMKGDRVAVHIPSKCVYNNSMTYEYCPLQIKYHGNDVKVIDWAYSFDDVYEEKELQIKINKYTRIHVGFNFQMKYCIKKG